MAKSRHLRNRIDISIMPLTISSAITGDPVAKLRRESHPSMSDASSLRLRAAWLYYNQGLTQKDVAERLGISRSTVIRLLDEAMKRSEVDRKSVWSGTRV